MAVPLNTDANGTDLTKVTYTTNTDYRDEWFLSKRRNSVQLESQHQSNWCWAACARMMSSYYMEPCISQESVAVYIMLNVTTLIPSDEQISEANDPADVSQTARSVERLLGSDNCYSIWGEIYSESVLRSLLDSSTPVVALRGWYNNDIRSGGHYVVIYDYYFDNSLGTYMYNIFDPSPVNVGSSYSKSYQAICNGRNGLTFQEIDSGIWEGIVVFEVGAYTETIAYPKP